ncbi:MAG TPA: ankyrin repeat domain-containing protein, partial [Burkholderiales bacterium]
VEIVSRLLERKADPKRRSAAGDSALMMAALKGDAAIARMLVDAGAEINHPGWAPLHYAAFSGHEATVRLLLDRGADKDAVAPNGFSPLMLATRNGHLGAVRELLFSDPDLNFRSVDGLTALKLAVQREKKEVEALLRRAGGVE